MPDKIKVLMLIDEASMGGGQKHLLLLAKYLDKNKFKVEVACEGKGFLVDELIKMEIPIHPLHLTNMPGIKSIWETINLVKKVNPAIIHSHGGTAGFYSRFASIFNFSGGVIHTYHGIHYLNFKRNLSKILFRSIDKFLLRFTDCTICVAQNDFDLGLKHGVVRKQKAIVIKNGIEVDKFLHPTSSTSSDIEKDVKENRLVIGSVGRLHHQKGYEYLIRSSKSILNKFPNVKFVIAGDGELMTELTNLCKKMEVIESFSFIGNQDDIPKVMSQFDVFVLPSLWEGLPLVILEAMAAKKPVIATNVNGIVEIIESGINGILVPARDPEALASAIIMLIENESLRESIVENAFIKVNAEFNVTEMIKKTEELYLSTFKRKLC